eukprot:jgi/Psemu1/18282/gm1.18282_g
MAFQLQSSNHLRAHLDWPRCPPPWLLPALQLWQRALRKSFLPPLALPSARALHPSFHLGHWLSSKSSSVWPWFLCRSTDRIFSKCPTGWKVGSSQGRGRYSFNTTILCAKPACADTLVSLLSSGNVFRIVGPSTFISHPPDKDPLTYDPFTGLPATPEDAFDALCASPRVLLHQYSLPQDGCQALANAIMSGSASAVCDGSYDPILLRGTSSFILSPNTSTKAPTVFLTGSNLVSGSPEDQSSYRSELAGIGVLTCCMALVDLYDVASGSLTIALDGDTALQQAQGTWPLSISQKSFDYVYVIRNMLSALPITVTFKWVQGHQEGLSLD